MAKKTTSVSDRLGSASREKTSSVFGAPKDLSRIVSIEIVQLHRNPDQPRKVFHKGKLRELADTIDEHGQLQPILVKVREEAGYVIVAGERRVRAHELLEKETIEAVITSGDPTEIAIIENVQRENLEPLEEAEAIARLIEVKGYNQDTAARVIGKHKSTVSQILKLNMLPDSIKEEVWTSKLPISKSLLIEVARAKSEPEQLKLWGQVKRGSTVKSARQTKDDDMRKVLSPQERMLSAGRSFLRSLRRIPTMDLVSNQDQLHELLELRKEIDEHVDGLTSEPSAETT